MIEGKQLVLGALIAAVFAVAGPAAAQQIKLTFADQNSPAGWGPAHALTPWVQQVEEATKGRVKLEVFPSQTLIKGIDMWKGIRTGIADIGWCVHGYWWRWDWSSRQSGSSPSSLPRRQAWT
jgi:TRAP-type transport system periplasmic protein